MLSFSQLEAKQREKLLQRSRKSKHPISKGEGGQAVAVGGETGGQGGTTHLSQNDGENNDNATPTATDDCMRLATALSLTQPLSHAVHQDLVQLQTEFLRRLSLLSPSTNPIRQPPPPQPQPQPAKTSTATTRTTATTMITTRSTPFECFRRVAIDHQMAALHRLVPPRCDAASFAQLLYASCLDLVQVAAQETKTLVEPPTVPEKNDNNDDSSSGTAPPATTTIGNDDDTCIQLAKQAFAIFSLYMLHETNPLPVLAPITANTDDHDQDRFIRASTTNNKTLGPLSALPMGLTNRQNPRLLYRRNYRPLIRIDPQSYTTLLQVRYFATACRDAGAAAGDVVLSPTNTATTTTTSPPPTMANLLPLIATDLENVLDRLWPHLDLAAYIGPMGLHGLSQRQQLQNALHQSARSEQASSSSSSSGQKPPPMTTRMNQRQDAAAAKTHRHSHNTAPNAQRMDGTLEEVDTENNGVKDNCSHAHETATDTVDNEEEELSTQALQDQMQAYLDHRRALRLPPSNTTTPRFQRIRQAMQPMSLDNTNSKRDWENRLRRLLQNKNTTNSSNGKRGDENAAALSTTTTKPLQRPSRVVTFAIPNAGEELHAPQRPETFGHRKTGNLEKPLVEEIHRDNTTSPRESFELVLPCGIPNQLCRSLETMVQTLVNRHGTGLFQMISKRAAETEAARSRNSTTASSRRGDDEQDGETLESHDAAASLHSVVTGESDAASIGTASEVGRGALQALIALANPHTNESEKAPASIARHQNQSRDLLSFFMQGSDDDDDDDDMNRDEHRTEAVGRRRRKNVRSQPVSKKKPNKRHRLLVDNDELSNASLHSDDGDDAISASGASTVGCQALADLLNEASKAAATTTTFRRSSQRMQKVQPSKKRRLRIADALLDADTSLDSNHGDDAVSASGASTVGRRALADLLQQVDTGAAASAGRKIALLPRERKPRKQRAKKLDKDEQLDECFGSDDDGGDAVSVSGASAVGRRALADLLQEADTGSGAARKGVLRHSQREERMQPTKKRPPLLNDDELWDASLGSDNGDDAVSASGASTVGRQALADLLKEAGKAARALHGSFSCDEDDSEDDDDHDGGYVDYEDDEASAWGASSMAGRRALEDLLLAAVEGDDTP